VSSSASLPKPAASRPLRLRLNGWLRWLHIYTSMISLMVVLFFSATGVTLNHPEWLPGETRQDYSGTLPAGWNAGGTVDWLKVAEFLRTTHGVRGTAHDNRVDAGQGSISFSAPGYSADSFFDPSGAYKLTVTSQGLLAVVNDLHRGRDAGKAWSWLIDFAGYFLVVISLTGLGLLLYLKKVRLQALAVVILGAVAMAVLMRLTT
jgi:uncharacterized protein